MEPIFKHRVFLGLPVPIDVAHRLADWSARNFTESDVRLLSPHDLHATLLFSPDMSTNLVKELLENVATSQWRSVTASTQALRFFGQSAIAITLNVDPVDVARLETIDLSSLRPFFFGARAPLAPHITVARSRSGTNLNLARIKPPEIDIEFTELALYESTLTNDGATYRILASAKSDL